MLRHSSHASRTAAVLLSIVIATAFVARPSASSMQAHRDYEVPPGMSLALEIRTELSSGTARRDDEIEARLYHAVASDGVELLPAGSVVRGTVRAVERAGKRKPGRLVFTFHVMEHLRTASRATIRTTDVEFQSVRPEKGHLYPEVRVEKGTRMFVSLRAPLVVRIPAE